MSFSDWGNRQLPDWKSGIPSAALPTSDGYTGHHQLDQHKLVHMGGRVYDPNLGRFLSADLFVQSPYSTQSFNRYTYVSNNPLSRIDPSGYEDITVIDITANVYTPYTPLIMPYMAAEISNISYNYAAGEIQSVSNSPVNSGIYNKDDGSNQYYDTDNGSEFGNLPKSVRKFLKDHKIKGVDKSHPLFHEYSVLTKVCALSAYCDKEQVLEKLRYYASIGADPSVRVNDKGSNTLLLGNNPVWHVVDQERYTLANITSEGLIFSYGFVLRTVLENGGNIYVQTYGAGVNTNWFYRDMNLALGPVIFQLMDFNLRLSYYQERPPLMMDYSANP